MRTVAQQAVLPFPGFAHFSCLHRTPPDLFKFRASEMELDNPTSTKSHKAIKNTSYRFGLSCHFFLNLFILRGGKNIQAANSSPRKIHVMDRDLPSGQSQYKAFEFKHCVVPPRSSIPSQHTLSFCVILAALFFF